jgi:hypothetical protein
VGHNTRTTMWQRPGSPAADVGDSDEGSLLYPFLMSASEFSDLKAGAVKRRSHVLGKKRHAPRQHSTYLSLTYNGPGTEILSASQAGPQSRPKLATRATVRLSLGPGVLCPLLTR